MSWSFWRLSDCGFRSAADPAFPLPAILACLVIDAADQTLFQNNTDLDLTGHQGYDKALDINCLTIAYLPTLPNWTNPFAFGVSVSTSWGTAIGENLLFVGLLVVVGIGIGVAVKKISAVSFVIVVNSFVGFWFTRRGRSWATTSGEFAAMAVVNLASALVFVALARNSEEPLNEAAALFFVVLLTLIVTMFDRYHCAIPAVIGESSPASESAFTE